MEMKKILFLEDNLVELQAGGDELRKSGYNVMLVSTTAKAEDLLKNGHIFDCLIIDLNMNNSYLPDSLKHKTHAGSLTGWVWLYYIAKPLFKNHPQIIIYSEFIDELLDEMETADDDMEDYFKNIKTISKSDTVNRSKNLVKEVSGLFDRRKV